MKPTNKDTTTPVVTDRSKRRCGQRDITIEWPDPPMDFPVIEAATKVEQPCLMIPWGGGQRLIYSVDDQQTYWPHTPPAWAFYPVTQVHLYGEEYRLGMGALKFWLTMIANQKPGGISGQIDTFTFLVNDIYDPELTAVQRSYKMVNLGAQPEGVFVSPVYQANSVETFNKYLTYFQESGFIGALVRPLEHMIGEPEYAVINPL